MKCLTTAECRNWVKSRGMTLTPHPSRIPPVRQIRLPGPQILGRLASQFAGVLEKDSNLLVLVDDWALYKPEEMDSLVELRAESGEQRPLIEAPGHDLRRSDP